MQALRERADALTGRYPDYAFGWKALGLALLALKQRQPAQAALRKSLDLQPGDAEGWTNLGILLQEDGKVDEAEQALRRALDATADLASAQGALGILLLGTGRMDEAESLLRKACAASPSLPKINGALGEILGSKGLLEEAEHHLKREYALDTGNIAVIHQIGLILHRQGRLADAATVLAHVIELKPDFAEAHNNLGVVLQQGGHLMAAEESFRKGLVLRPDAAETYSNLGNVLQRLGRFIEAQTCFRRALALKPGFFDAHSNLLGAMNESDDVTPQMRLGEAQRYGESLARAVQARFGTWICENRPARLKVGLVSGDFRQHPVAYFTLALLRALDRNRIEICAYATDLKTDAMTTQLKAACDHWVMLVDMDDDAAAARIHADGIHVLIDMSGHTADNRLPVFARRPAPVQVSWPGYFATTGVVEMDWFLADSLCLPEQNAAHFTERIWYLPETRLCFAKPENAPEPGPLPMLESGAPTFGCFQNLSKLGDRTLKLWARVLDAIPQASLRLQSRQLSELQSVERLKQCMEQCGIDPERVRFHGPTDREAYLAAYRDVDLVLDTFPYTGGTTTCEALWMGVPTLTLAGDSLISRQGASLMQAAGLEDWIAADEDAFVAKAVDFVSDPERLAGLRTGMRARLVTTPLFDADRFARHFEDAMEGMWKHHQEQKEL
nr:tetratricopeptide repeat protein [Azoarcus sp. L1K30]